MAGKLVDGVTTVDYAGFVGLVAEKGVPSSDVNVEVYKGVVLLSGFVATESARSAAGRAATT